MSVLLCEDRGGVRTLTLNRPAKRNALNAEIGAWCAPPVIAGYEPPMGAVPALGEHTDAVLAELGYAVEEIAVLRERGVVG